jgi:hypothetical protein
MTQSANLAKDQQVIHDMTGLGHNVIGEYVGPIEPSAKFPEGGHRIKVRGKIVNLSRTLQPYMGSLVAVTR